MLSIILLIFSFFNHKESQTTFSLSHGEIAGPSTFPIEITKFAPSPDNGYTTYNNVLSSQMSLNKNFVMLIFLKTCRGYNFAAVGCLP